MYKSKQLISLTKRIEQTKEFEKLIENKAKINTNYYTSKNQNVYNYVLQKSLNRYYYKHFHLNKYRYAFNIGLGLTAFGLYKLTKWYFVLYYFIMYEVDIRKPKVSDFILERYR